MGTGCGGSMKVGNGGRGSDLPSTVESILSNVRSGQIILCCD